MVNDKKGQNKITSGEKVGSFLKVLSSLLSLLLRFIFKLLKTLGLIPLTIYCLFGAILYLFTGFNPIDGSLNAKLYLIGFTLSIVVAVILAGRNIIVKPAKNIIAGYTNPVWQRKNAEEEKIQKEPLVSKKPSKKGKKTSEEPVAAPQMAYYEQPKVYNSVVDPSLVIYEYSDRFEVFRRVGNTLIKDKIEFKDYEQ